MSQQEIEIHKIFLNIKNQLYQQLKQYNHITKYSQLVCN